MSLELGVVAGLAFTSAILGYYAMQFRQQTEEEDRVGDKLSLLFFILSMLFLNLLMYAMLLMAQNSSLTYLQGPVLVIALQIMTYGTIAVLVVFVAYLFIGFLAWLYEYFMQVIGRRRG